MPSTRRCPGPARPAVVAVLALAVALTASACGGPGTPASSPTGSPAATTGEPGRAASATALRRSGGVAGFDDRLSVAADGRVTGTTRSATVECEVPDETVQTLATAAAPAPAPAAGTDRMTVTLARDGGPVALGEAQGTDALSTTARTLLDDVQLPPGTRTLCR